MQFGYYYRDGGRTDTFDNEVTVVIRTGQFGIKILYNVEDLEEKWALKEGSPDWFQHVELMGWWGSKLANWRHAATIIKELG